MVVPAARGTGPGSGCCVLSASGRVLLEGPRWAGPGFLVGLAAGGNSGSQCAEHPGAEISGLRRGDLERPRVLLTLRSDPGADQVEDSIVTLRVLERTGLRPALGPPRAQAVSALPLCTLRLTYVVKSTRSELRLLGLVTLPSPTIFICKWW